jgi:hypothetical protein
MMNDTSRQLLASSILSTCTIERTAEQIALFGVPRFQNVYVERRGNAYRWSIVHWGGAYPLLRELALLLDVPYTPIVLPFDTVDGWAIVRAADLKGDPDSWALIEPSTDVSINVERLLAATA